MTARSWLSGRGRRWAAGAAFAAVLAACAPAGTTTPPPGPTTVSDVHPKDDPPEELMTIEAKAEDLVDVVPTGNWDRVTANVAEMTAALDSLRADPPAGLSGLADLDTTLEALEGVLAGRDPAEVMQAANDVSGATVEALDSFDLGYPTDVGRLDVIGRQVKLDAERGEGAAAIDDLDRIRAIWDALSADVARHGGDTGGDTVVSDTDETVATMRSAAERGDWGDVAAEASAFLELVDGMETVYG